MAGYRALQRFWYEKAGISDDIERDGLLVHEFGSRSADAQDLAFAGEMAAAAEDISKHPALSRREKQIWIEHCRGRTYREVADICACSFRDVSATIDKAQNLMLRPRQKEKPMPKRKGAGRPKAIHRDFDGQAACKKAVPKSLRSDTWSDVTCTKCIHAHSPMYADQKKPGRPKKVKVTKVDREAGEVTTSLVTEEERKQLAELDSEIEFMIPGDVDFVDIESTIEMGVKVAHRKIVELSTKVELTPLDVATNERAVHTLLAVRKSELEYLKGKIPVRQPDEQRAQEIAGSPDVQPTAV